LGPSYHQRNISWMGEYRKTEGGEVAPAKRRSTSKVLETDFLILESLNCCCPFLTVYFLVLVTVL